MMNRNSIFTYEGNTFRTDQIALVTSVLSETGSDYQFSICMQGGTEVIIVGSDEKSTEKRRNEFIDLWVHGVTSHE